jgi:DNA-directed RNA polymerase specialized sigma24 family protein
MTAPAIDRTELAKLYDRYGGVVFRRARRLLGDEALARDVCHDVFVEILKAWPEWSPPSPIGWLYTATTNKCLNVLRRNQRFHQAARAQTRWAESSSSPGLPLGLILKDLPEPLQEIAIYYGLDEMNQEEIALVLGVSQKTVSNRIQEIRTRLAAPETGRRLEAT